MKNVLLTLAIVALSAAAAQAVTINIDVNGILGADMSPLKSNIDDDYNPAPPGKIVTFIVDLDGTNGTTEDYKAQYMNVTEGWAAPGDYAFGPFEVNGFSNTPQGSHAEALLFNLGEFGIQGGERVFAIWYDKDFPAAAPGAGTSFGLLSDPSWTVPTANGDIVPFNMDAGNLGSDAGKADKVTVPEPASIALIGLGGLLIARRRR